MAKRAKAKSSLRLDRDGQTVLLEFIAGILILPPDADEGRKIKVARKAGLKSDQVERIFGKTPAAARKALQRAGRTQ